MGPQYLHRVRIRQFMGAEDIEIYGAEVNEIAGRCASGKTSFLKALEAGFVGAKAVPSEPITLGGHKATVELETDDLLFCLTCEEGEKPEWVCIGKDGGKFKHGEIEALTSKLWFDPTVWVLKPKDKMREDLLSLAPKEWVDRYWQLRHDQERAENTRLLAGREVRALGELPDEPPNIQPVDVVALSEQLDAIRQHNQAEQQKLADWQRTQDSRRHALTTAERDEREALAAVDAAEAALVRAKNQLEQAQKRREALPKPEETAPAVVEKDATSIKEQLATARETNTAADAHKKWADLVADYTAKDAKHREAEMEVERIRKEQAEHTAALHLPVEGLRIMPDGDIMFGDLPCPEHVNTGELMLISAELAMAQNATLRIMLMHRGEAFDDVTFARLVELGRRKKVQTWLATTDKTGRGHGQAIHISEGRVIADRREDVPTEPEPDPELDFGGPKPRRRKTKPKE